MLFVSESLWHSYIKIHNLSIYPFYFLFSYFLLSIQNVLALGIGYLPLHLFSVISVHLSSCFKNAVWFVRQVQSVVTQANMSKVKKKKNYNYPCKKSKQTCSCIDLWIYCLVLHKPDSLLYYRWDHVSTFTFVTDCKSLHLSHKCWLCIVKTAHLLMHRQSGCRLLQLSMPLMCSETLMTELKQ